MWRKGISCVLGRNADWCSHTGKAVWSFLKKLKMKLPYNPAILILGIHLNKIETLIQKNICIPVFIAALFIIAKIWK